MCSQNTTNKSTDDYLQKIELLKEKLLHADKVLVGAGAGLSTAAGFTYSGERFTKNFSDFEKKYGFHDMYSGGFYPYYKESSRNAQKWLNKNVHYSLLKRQSLSL